MSTQAGRVIRWGVIGVGDVVEHKSGRAFQTVPGSALVAVMRRDAERAADFARRFGVPRWYADADELLADPEVDAVYVATPPDSHASYTARAAAAGKPVYVEKPMARTAGECEQMISDCTRAGVPLFVAYYRRAMPRFATAVELVRSGRIGAVRSVVVRHQRPADRPSSSLPWRLDPQMSGGGHFVDLASHTLDWLDFLLGPVTDVSGAAAGPDGPVAETQVVARLSFGDVLGVGLWDYDAAESCDLIELVGDAGTLQLSTFGTEPLRLTTAHGTTEIPGAYPPVVQEPLISNVVASLRGEADPLSTGASALRTARVIDSILAEHRRTHHLVF
ncbi:Gfo/Idh/MocA family oxidoreductase [Microlunatus aurantiacus]|uniref:Gfo/Idh/MocA family oxidoreductase n=1 Tax=Microlunatus aurantiacus TaxID=446786 RepID=A0ABP7D2P8_9ACTN